MNTAPKRQFIESTRTLINKTTTTTISIIVGLSIETTPEVFNPQLFFSSSWFAEKVATLVQDESVFIEIGCGSGIVSIKSVVVNPHLIVHASDINRNASELTAKNARRNHVKERITTYCGDVLDGIPAQVQADSIFWSLPFGYLPRGEILTERDSQTFDPGYRAINKLFQTAKNNLAKNGRLLLGFSSDIGHFELLREAAKNSDFSLSLLEKTTGIEGDEVSMELYEAKVICS